jgi:hypothetical protein
MKSNRNQNKLQKNLRAESSVKQSKFSKFREFSTLEVIFLATLPIDAAIWYAHITPTAPVAMIERTPAPIEVIHPVFKPEPFIATVSEKRIETIFKPLQVMAKTAPEIKPAIPVEPTIEELLKKEAVLMQDHWGEDLVEWNRQANEKVKQSMDQYAMQPNHEAVKSRRVVGRMAYAFQDGTYFQRSPASGGVANSANDSNLAMAQISAMIPTRVGSYNYANQVGTTAGSSTTGSVPAGRCSLRPPVSPDPRCRANYACRICGGCCCLCEARLAGL